MVFLRVEICASASLALRLQRRQDQLVVGGDRHADRALDVGRLDLAAALCRRS